MNANTTVNYRESYHVGVVEVARFGDGGEVAFIIAIELYHRLDAVPRVFDVIKVTCQVARCCLSRVVRLKHHNIHQYILHLGIFFHIHHRQYWGGVEVCLA